MPVDPRIQEALEAPLRFSTIDDRGLASRVRNRGYAATPGTGPSGETCRTCKRLYFVSPNIKRFYKCRLTPLTSGPASDVLVRSPACSQWQAKAPE
jgi:hypothetical protein